MTVAAFNEKYKLFIESDAQKTLTEMNKLKTFLTTDLGAAIVQAVNQFLGFAGGADAIGAAIKALVPVVMTGVAAFGGFAAAMGVMAINARLAALGLGPLGLAVNGLLVGLTAYAAFDFANTRIIQSIRQAEEEFHQVGNGPPGHGPRDQSSSGSRKRTAPTKPSSSGRTKPWPSSAKTTSRWWTTPRRTTSG